MKAKRETKKHKKQTIDKTKKTIFRSVFVS